MRYKLFKPKGFFDVLAVGPGNPFNPGSPEAAQELVDQDQVADRAGNPVSPAPSSEGAHRDLRAAVDRDERRRRAGRDPGRDAPAPRSGQTLRTLRPSTPPGRTSRTTSRRISSTTFV